MCTDQTFTTHGEEVVLAVSLELAAAKWKVALHDGRREKPAVHAVAQPQAAARLQAVLDLIEAHKEKWLLPAGVRVVVSYEAGQDAVKRHKVDREIDLKSSHRQIRERAILKNRFLSTRCRIIDVKSSHLARRLTPSMATFEAILPILLS